MAISRTSRRSLAAVLALAAGAGLGLAQASSASAVGTPGAGHSAAVAAVAGDTYVVTPLSINLAQKDLVFATKQGAVLRLPATIGTNSAGQNKLVPDAYTWYYRFHSAGKITNVPTSGLTGELAGFTQVPAFTGDTFDLAFPHVDHVDLTAVPNPAYTFSATPQTLYLNSVNLMLGNPSDMNLDGISDELMVSRDGTLKLFANDGPLTSPSVIAGNYAAVNWIGSPGDLNGDHLSDRLMRLNNGDLVAYFAGGAGEFSRTQQVGIGWGQMDPNKLFVARNYTDGKPSILAVNTTNCQLYRYDLSETGTVVSAAAIGTGWCGMRQVFSAGDQTGDGKTDIVGIAQNGDYLVYAGDGHGGFAGGPFRKGTGWFFDKVTAPGGYEATILALKHDGTLVKYQSNDNASWMPPQVVMTDWYHSGYSVME